MRHWMLPGLLALAVSLVAGCEWSSGGGADDTNDRFNFVNFSGVYRGLEGTPLVSDFTGTPAVERSVTGEKIAEGDGITTVFAGSVDNTDLVPASITISAPGFTFVDADGDGVLVGSPAGSGSIVYETGAFTLDFAGSAPAFGVPVIASYVFTVSGISSGPGSTGGRIDTFTVIHEGNRLTILDNLGAVYEGNMGSIRSSGGVDQDFVAQDQDILEAVALGIVPGSDIIAQFEVKGVSAAGLAVTITGVFTGTISEDGNTLGRRIIEGTFVEEGGMVGDVLGSAPSIDIDAPDITVPGEPDLTVEEAGAGG